MFVCSIVNFTVALQTSQFCNMGDVNPDSDLLSVIIEPSYDSTLSAGLDATRYYLSKSVKDSTKQQVFEFFEKFVFVIGRITVL